MRDDESRLPLASLRDTEPASSRALLGRPRRRVRGHAVHVRPRPQFETDERPDALRMIARSAPMLVDECAHLKGSSPPTLLGARIVEEVARPVDHLILEPTAQRNTEAALGPLEHGGRHPGPNHLAE